MLNTTTVVTDPQVLTAPTGLVAKNITTTSFTVSWTAATDNVGIVAYNLYDGTKLATSTTGGAITYNATGLTADTTYNITIILIINL